MRTEALLLVGFGVGVLLTLGAVVCWGPFWLWLRGELGHTPHLVAWGGRENDTYIGG